MARYSQNNELNYVATILETLWLATKVQYSLTDRKISLHKTVSNFFSHIDM